MDLMRLIPFLPVVLAPITVFIVIPAILASKLCTLAPPGMSHGRCFRLIMQRGIGATPPLWRSGPITPYDGSSPLQEGTEEFRQRLITYKMIVIGMGFLLFPIMWGLFMILNHKLNNVPIIPGIP